MPFGWRVSAPAVLGGADNLAALSPAAAASSTAAGLFCAVTTAVTSTTKRTIKKAITTPKESTKRDTVRGGGPIIGIGERGESGVGVEGPLLVTLCALFAFG